MKRPVNLWLSLLLLTNVLACVQTPKAPEETDDRKKPAFGIKFSPQAICFSQRLENGSLCGFKMEVVFPYLAASKAGLRTNDILVGFDQETFTHLKDSDVPQFTARLGQLKVGQLVRMTILREDLKASYQINQGKPVLLGPGELPPIQQLSLQNGQSLVAQWNRHPEILTFEFKVEGRTWHSGDQKMAESFETRSLPKEIALKTAVQKMMATADPKTSLLADVTDLEQRLTDLDILVDRRRLPVVTYLQNNPWRIQDLQNLWLKNSACTRFQCLEAMTSSVGLKLEAVAPLKGFDVSTPMGYLKLAEKVYLESEAMVQQALKELSAEEKIYLKAHALEMTDQLAQGIYLHEDEDKNRLQRDLKIMELMQKVDIALLAKAILPYQQLLNPALFEKFRARTDSNQEFVAILKTPSGNFVMGGKNANNYVNLAVPETVFILDLGGDDIYPDISANIIDVQGNDTYEASMPWTLASGFLRARILIDMQGNDSYQVSDGGLASSLFGSSFLLDMQGNDSYRSRYFSMGVGFTGFSILLDEQGNDSYQSLMLSQGVGIAGGVGVLMDKSGADTYFSKGGNPSSYRDPGQFDGWSQGLGLGLRNFVSGGWGFLYDGGPGQNRFESGTFSQGGGYFFGLGTLISDGRNDDFYSAARYSQGFAAHNAIGNFLDTGGKDIYQSSSDVGEGMAWDLSLTLFEDRAGNDTYKTCAHCLGMASQNSFAFFVDAQGDDLYKGVDLPFGGKRVNDYHGGKSFGLFWDQGHGKDQYSKFKNNSQETLGDWQILKDE